MPVACMQRQDWEEWTTRGRSVGSSPMCREECVMNQLDPIEELYDMYSEEEDTLRIVEVNNDGLGLDLDIEGLANPYMDL